MRAKEQSLASKLQILDGIFLFEQNFRTSTLFGFQLRSSGIRSSLLERDNVVGMQIGHEVFWWRVRVLEIQFQTD